MFASALTPLIDLFRSLKLSAPENLKERYEESVSQLAKVDPLLAYQLSGRPRTDFNDIADTFIEKATQLEGEKAQAGSNPDAVSRFSSFFKSYGLRKMLDNMETDIVDVAKEIGYFTHLRTRRRLDELTLKLSDNVEEIVDQLLDSLGQFASQGESTTNNSLPLENNP